MSYAANKNWRLRYPAKRNAQTKKYYAKNRETPENRRQSGEKWTREDSNLITAVTRPVDSVVAKRIGRSVRAVQARRAYIKKISIR